MAYHDKAIPAHWDMDPTVRTWNPKGEEPELKLMQRRFEMQIDAKTNLVMLRVMELYQHLAGPLYPDKFWTGIDYKWDAGMLMAVLGTDKLPDTIHEFAAILQAKGLLQLEKL